MTIDKDQEPLIKAHILTSYGNTVERTLLAFIIKDINEIAATMRITTSKKLNYAQIQALKHEEMQSKEVKRSLIVRLNVLRRIEEDIINEVLKVYGLNLSKDDLQFYHDVLGEHLRQCANHIEDLIRDGNLLGINYRLNQLTAN